jgi:hypothetical protein
MDALRASPLAPLLARSSAGARVPAAGPQPAQRWLWQQLGGADERISAPYAYAALREIEPAPLWFCEPVHYAAGIDDITVLPLDAPWDSPLGSPHDLQSSTAEAAALREAADAVARANGAQVLVVEGRWFLQLEQPWQIDAAPLEAVLGGSLRRHWPSGLHAPRWRRLLTEVQMAWHNHPVNAARENRGARSVNGLWLHGGGQWQPLPARPWQAVRADDPVVLGWMQAAGVAPAACRPMNASLPAESTLFFDASLVPLLAAGDHARWLDYWRTLTLRIDAFQRHAFSHGAAEVELLLAGRATLRTLTLRRTDALRFWRRQQLPDLLPEAPA